MHYRTSLFAACALAAGILVGILGWMISPASSSMTALATTSGGPALARSVGSPSTPFSVESEVMTVEARNQTITTDGGFTLPSGGQPSLTTNPFVSDDAEATENADPGSDNEIDDSAELTEETEAEGDVNETNGDTSNTSTNSSRTGTTRTPTTSAPVVRNNTPTSNTSTQATTPPTTAAPRPTTAAPRRTTTTTTRPPTTTTTAPTVRARTSSPTVHVATNGSDSNNGSSSAPVASFSRAAQLASPGDSIVFASGTYDAIRITGVNGTSSNPIRIVGSSGTQFRSSSYSREAGILVRDSSNIVIDGVEVRHALWGVYIQNSHGIKLLNSDIRDIGQEMVRIKDGSSNILVQGNYIADSGNRTDKGHANGEGVYIGTGTPSNVDHVSNVIVRNNTITQLTDEAIDIKIPSTNVLIEGNTITNVHTQTTGAVVAHLNSTRGGDPQIRIIGNTIRDVTRSTPYRDGNCIVAMATVLIQNNTIQNCQHRGVFIQGSSGTATIVGNSFSNTGELGAIVNDGRGMSISSSNNSGAGSAHQ